MFTLIYRKSENGQQLKKVRLGWVLFTLLVCLVVGGASTEAGAAEKGPIKIGYIAAITGNFAQFGNDMLDGFKMFLDEVNYTVAGRKIELIVEDESSNPAIALTKARKLITHDKVHFISGVFLASSGYSVPPACIEAEIPLVMSNATGDDLTQRRASKYLIRINFGAGSEIGLVAGDYAYKKLGWRKAAVFAMDYAWGYEVGGGFQRSFEDAGGKVVQKVWTPMVTQDYAPYVTNLKRDVDGIFEIVTGAATLRFFKALRVSGHKWQVMGPGQITDESFLSALGDDSVGAYSVQCYSAALQIPANIKFREKVRKSLKKDPNVFIAINYTTADWIVRAIKAINGDVENKDKFLEAVRSVEIPDSIRGPLKLDKYGAIIQNQYIRRTEKVGDQYQNTVLETYPMPTQFWKYDPDTHMKSPVFSRDYPPCKYCE
jgi:branched-chain amino acid transport system substrate-binding protein